MKAFKEWLKEKAGKALINMRMLKADRRLIKNVAESSWRAAMEEVLKHDLSVDDFENSEIVAWIKKELKED